MCGQSVSVLVLVAESGSSFVCKREQGGIMTSRLLCLLVSYHIHIIDASQVTKVFLSVALILYIMYLYNDTHVSV